MKREIVKRALSGDIFNDLNIVDCHCHMGPWYSFYFPTADIHSMIEDAERVGVNTICIFPHASISCDYKLGNHEAAEAISAYPAQVLGLITLNANKPDEISEEFNRYYSMPSFIGVKLHPSIHNYSLNSENAIQIYEKVRKHGGYITIHTWESDSRCNIEICESVIKEYSDIAFILAHAGGLRSGVEKSIDLINRYANAYIDTSGFEFSNIWIEEIVKKADITKIMFGSDYPFHDIRGGISRILFADMDDNVKTNILGENFRRMMKKYPKK